jgi:hypothetical protein
LLDLNDQVTSVLTKADRVAQNEKRQVTNRNYSQKGRGGSGGGGAIMSPASSSNQRTPYSQSVPDASPSALQNIVNIVYSLRRITDREETLIAVENLISLCELEGEIRLSAIKQMMTAGALQVLLTVLQRSSEWPEVEMQISKLISVLVTYEDDYILLQRSSLMILTSLYTLQAKTQSRVRSRSRSGVGIALSRNLSETGYNENIPGMITASSSAAALIPSNQGLSFMSLSDSASLSQRSQSERLSILTGDNNNNSNINHPLSITMGMQQDFIDPIEQQNQDIRALVAAAVAKLSLVLSNEWSKQESPFGEFPIPAGGNVSGLSGMSVSNGFQHGVDRVEKMRSLITRHSKSIVTGRPSSINDNSSSSMNMDANRVLQVLLNLITTISEPLLEHYELESAKMTPAKPSSSSLLIPSFSNSLTLSNSISSFQQQENNPLSYSTTNNDFTESRIDQFLHTTFGISLTILLSGSLHHELYSIKPKLVDNSAVFCSTALVNIAEIPHCRPGLVANGALRIIKSWLEISCNILKVMQIILKDYSSQIAINGNLLNFQELFFHLLSPVYELLNNATASLMFLAGGSADNKINAAYFSPSNPLQSGGGRDYIIGWIDAQILAEGLPEVLVNLVSVSHYSFLQSYSFPFLPISVETQTPSPLATTAVSSNSPLSPSHTPTLAGQSYSPASSTMERTIPLSPCSLPASISKNIARFLFQICSRPQNRQRLQGSLIPFTLCTIFERSVIVMKYIIEQTTLLGENQLNEGGTIDTESHGHSLKGGNNNNSMINQFNEFYRKVFEYGTLDNIRSPLSKDRRTASNSNQHQQSHQSTVHNDQNHHQHHHDHHNEQQQRDQLHSAKKPADLVHQISSSARFFGSFMGGNSNSKKEPISSLHAGLADHSKQQIHQFKVSIELMDLLSLVTAACLDTIGNYFNDEIARAPFTQASAKIAAIDSSLPTGKLSSSSNIPLISLMSNPKIMAAILMVTSTLSKGVGRLGAIRIISSLTEWPDSLIALYEGSVMDALLLICSETEEYNNPQQSSATANRISETKITPVASNHPAHPANVGSSYDMKTVSTTRSAGGPPPDIILPSKLGSVERTTSGNSSVSGLSSCNSVSKRSHSFHRISSMFGGRNESGNGGGTTPITSLSHLEDYMDDEELLHADMALEETLYVCYSLANLCLANPVYAYRMFTSGLLMIMSRLVRSTHLEISHQALRCMNAMISVVAAKQNEDYPIDSLVTSDKTGGKTPTLTPKQSSVNNRFILRDILDVLTDAMRSHSPLVQKEAILSISQLCLCGEEFRDRIMNGCMRSITSISVNPNFPRDLRSAAEEVIRNCGFLSGLKDFEICGFDYEILKEWYFLKRSLKAQEQARKLLNSWVERLFSDVEPLYGRQSLMFIGRGGTGNDDSIGTIGAGGSTYESEIYQFALAGEIADLLKVTQFTTAKHGDTGGNSSSLSHQTFGNLPNLHRQFTDSLLKLLPICFPKFTGNSSSSSHQNHHDNTSSHHSSHHHSSHHGNNGGNVSDDFLDSSGYYRGSSMSSNSRDSHGGAGGPVSSSLTSTGSFLMNRGPNYSPATGMGGASSNHHHPSSNHPFDNYFWIDRPPLIVTNMYDLFYSSRIHQLLVMDLTSIGVCIPVSIPSSAFSNGLADSGGNDGEQMFSAEVVRPNSQNFEIHPGEGDGLDDIEEELAFLIPHPHPIYAILLPSRTYQTFSRFGRVLQRMFEHTSDPSQLWALSFRDCEYHGDFHTSLLATLQRCPQICSLSFSSTHSVEDDALLGHLVGQIPSTVRFISFRSTLSHESIQALCILLRTHNAAFLNLGDSYDDSFFPSSSSSSSFKGNNGSNIMKTFGSPTVAGDSSSTKSPSITDSKGTTANPPPSSSSDTYSQSTNKGLLGLALTHLTLDGPEIQHIVELLQPRIHSTSSMATKTPRSKMNNSNTPNSSLPSMLPLKRNESVNSSNASSTPKSNVNTKLFLPTTPGSVSNKMGDPHSRMNLKGLKYLDLGYNNLNDQDCAIIFKASINGPLEGLELGGNNIHKANKFIDILTMISSSKQIALNPNRLRYLGLSNNNLSNKAFTGILYKLVENTSLTSLDLSNNNIDSSATNNESLRSFIKKNHSLRLFDLSHNRLTSESYRLMHLGLLENPILLMLPLNGNPQVESSPTIELIQVRLRENRLLYKAQSKDFSYGFTKTADNDLYYPTEDIMSRISFNATYNEEGGNDTLMLNPNGTISEGITATNAMMIVEGDNEEGSSVGGSRVGTVGGGLDDSFEESSKGEIPMAMVEMTTMNDGIAAVPPHINHPIHSRSGDSKKLSILSPYDMKDDVSSLSVTSGSKDNIITPSVAVAFPIPSPRNPLHPPSIPSTPKRFSGKGLQPIDPANFSSHSASATSSMTASSYPSSAVLSEISSSSSIAASLEVGKSGESKFFSDESSISSHLKTPPSFTNTLNVLFSAPLAGFDRSGKAHPLEVLDYTSERDALIQVFKEVHRDISLHFDFATTDTLRTILSFGCKALHFSGHGVPKGLCFEDGKSGLQVLREQQLKDLLSAGGLALEFVFVSACYSKEIGEAFVKAGVSHVVCVKVDSKVCLLLFPRSSFTFVISFAYLDSRCSSNGIYESILCCIFIRKNSKSII